MVEGSREGRNKFLSNAFASQFPKRHKHHRTHLISSAALDQVNAKNFDALVYEHLVPKQKHIQGPCEARAREHNLTIEFVEDLLDRYWKVATITKTEDQRLSRTMPGNWDGKNIKARYESVGIELQDNPHFQSVVAD
jgi:hypothetical protein